MTYMAEKTKGVGVHSRAVRRTRTLKSRDGLFGESYKKREPYGVARQAWPRSGGRRLKVLDDLTHEGSAKVHTCKASR